MSSAGLRGPWLADLIQAIGDSALVSLQPGLEDREYILKSFGGRLIDGRLVDGMIPIVSYMAPLPGEDIPTPGIAYWIPPGSTGPFSGPEEIVKPLVTILRQGGFPARISRDVRRDSLVPSAILTVIITALENSDWSFQKLAEGSELKLASQAILEVLQAICRKREVKTPAFVSLIAQPLFFRSLLSLSRWIVPFDFETYLRVHFTKVQDQMHESMKEYSQLASDYSIPTPTLSKLMAQSKAKLSAKLPTN